MSKGRMAINGEILVELQEQMPEITGPWPFPDGPIWLPHSKGHFLHLVGAEENNWTKEEWSDGRVEKTA
jgi:hypothetical protein